MEFNNEQIKSGVRWFLGTCGGFLVGWGSSRGYQWTDILNQLLSSEVFIGLGTSIAVAIWGWFKSRKTSQIAAVVAMPEIKAVITTPTVAGSALAKSIPDPMVATAGTHAATEAAKT